MAGRVRITVRWDKGWEQWAVYRKDPVAGAPQMLVYSGNNKKISVTMAVQTAKHLTGAVNLAGLKAQVVIFGKDGKIQEERTYPRSSDPARTKGAKKK